MIKRLILLRHAHADRPANRCIGQWEHPLSRRGLGEISDLAANWLDPVPDRIVCSDIGRARHTAELLAEKLGAPAPGLDPRLREISMGEWEGKSWDDLYAEQPEALDRWGMHWVSEGPPGGESAEDVARRVLTVVAESPSGTLLVSHRGALAMLVCSLAGQPLSAAFNYSFAHAAPVSLD